MNAVTIADGRARDEDAHALVGDHYDETAGWTIEQVAEALRSDLLAVQGDEMLPAEAEFAISTDTAGRQDLIQVTISGLYRHDEDIAEAYTFHTGRTRAALASVFELASNYNRVDPAHLERARFIVVIELADDGGNSRPALVGVMQGVRPYPPLGGGACPTCGSRDTVGEEPVTTPA
jgi:hypothetical protein